MELNSSGALKSIINQQVTFQPSHKNTIPSSKPILIIIKNNANEAKKKNFNVSLQKAKTFPT